MSGLPWGFLAFAFGSDPLAALVPAPIGIFFCFLLVFSMNRRAGQLRLAAGEEPVLKQDICVPFIRQLEKCTVMLILLVPVS